MIVAGVTPEHIVEPQTIPDVADCIAELYGRDRSFAFAGGGTELELGNPPRALDTLVKSTACNRVIDYAPQDQTITVEAGMTLAAVGAELARERQFLPIDAADPHRTTVGGAIATNLFGGRRLRYGSIRDIIVGVEIVRPDGTRARGGGKVVKNVAGFDIPKLMVGSLGTLGAIVAATFRVYPLEEQRSAMIFSGLTVEQLFSLGTQLVGEALVPAAVSACSRSDAAGYDCCVTFAGFARGVAEQMRATGAIGRRCGVAGDVADDAAVAAFDARERTVRGHADWRVALAARPTELARFLATTPFLPDARRVVYPLVGAAFVAADDLDAVTIRRWRGSLDGTVIVTAMPQHERPTLDAWGEPPSSLAIMRRLKANFDPKGLCNAGRFVGGL